MNHWLEEINVVMSANRAPSSSRPASSYRAQSSIGSKLLDGQFARNRQQQKLMEMLLEAVAPLNRITFLTEILCLMLADAEEMTKLFFGIRSTTVDPYSILSYDMAIYPHMPEKVIYSPRTLHTLVSHASVPVPLSASEPHLFNFVFGRPLSRSGPQEPFFVFGSRQDRQVHGTQVQDFDVERGVKHFHLCSGKRKVIPLFAGAHGGVKQGRRGARSERLASVRPVGRDQGRREALL